MPHLCHEAWFLAVLSELFLHVELANFDREVAHAQMRAMLQATAGNPYAFSLASVMHMAAEVGGNHRQVTEQRTTAPARRGRPPTK
eukprot:14305707-Alexandrium_andersonii.AAC.1